MMKGQAERLAPFLFPGLSCAVVAACFEMATRIPLGGWRWRKIV
jgi:hypothetical protein